jgi:hypothetical protein
LDVDGSKVGIKPLTRKDVVEHLPAPVMQDAPTPIVGQRAVEQDE